MIATRFLWKALLAAFVARPAAALMAGDMLLFTNDFTPGVDVVVGDFVEPTYTDYARQPFVISGPFTDAGLDVFDHVADLVWTLSGASHDPQTIFGAALVDGGGHVLLAGRFPEMVPLNIVGDTCIVSADPKIGPSAIDLGPWVVEP